MGEEERMFYLQITTRRRRHTLNANPLGPTHGPFATPQEAEGFFTKLTIWYPHAMQRATYRVICEGEPGQRDWEHPSRLC
jgi:hypothetical protein